ncbi:MAG: methionyl-tRNA formyltransferase [Patescibacteria group bacterium]|nr:methionyl-tRNA formyltransferase [Patescibacteria group bacterium]
MKNNPRIIFFGTPEIAVPFLVALVKSKFNIIAVVTQPDRPAGRNNVLTPSPVKSIALSHRLPVLQFSTLKSVEVFNSLKSLKPDLFIVMAFGLLFPQKILDLTPLGCLNIHPSLLPKYRGASPIQSQILSGEKLSGLTIMKMDAGLDSGPVLEIMEFPLDNFETSITLTQKITKLGPDFLIETLKNYLDGKIIARPQDKSQATITKIIEKADGRIDWSKPVEEIERQIRAYQPWPGSYTFWDNLKIEIIKASVADIPTTEKSGTVIQKDADVYIATGKNILRIEELKPASKKTMAVVDFVRGHPNFIGSSLT